MSDHEGDAAQEGGEEIDLLEDDIIELTPDSSLKEVLNQALRHGGLVRGLRECVKALDRKEARLCVLAASCDEPAYVDLVRALCKHHNILLMSVPDNKVLGEYAGLCKLDKEGKPRKIVACSCVVVKEFGKQTESLNYLLEHLKSKQ